MNFSPSTYHLLAEANCAAGGVNHWHFLLTQPGGSLHLDVSEEEPDAPLDRLELLAVVRGLEALDQPSRVTLLTPSRYVARGLRDGLEQWRENSWQWESFGQMTPVKNEDLWRRVDQALEFHRVQCRLIRVDAAAADVPEPVMVRRRRASAAMAGGAPAKRERPARRIVLQRREQVEFSAGRASWLSLRQKVANMLFGLGQVIAPESAACATG
jgi:ribonuclease HI